MPLTDNDKTWITEQLTILRKELLDVIHAVRTELLERNEKTETSLLTDFHKWASPVELRQRSHAAAMRAFDAELEAVSDRVTKLEGA